MMKFVYFMIFMIPLSFMSSFWFSQFVYFILSFIFILSYSFIGVQFLGLEMGVDLLSYSLILLSFWICSLMVLSSSLIYKDKNWSKLFLLMILILLISLILTFSFMNLFLFYLFFEVSLVPTFMLIIGWGYQPERLQAGFYLFFYTLFASLPMMICLFYFFDIFNSLMNFYFTQIEEIMAYLLINFVFFIKIPMFFVHLWLPKAHVEAPVAGSMILAGLMLKLGGYGLMRFLVAFLKIGIKFNLIFISISMVGGLLISLVCLRQSDMKSLIAYSSVSHMSMVLGGIMSMNYWGSIGSLIMMVSHGLCSSGLFCLANINYERIHSRSLYLNKGLINLMPTLSLFWFLLVSSNMAAPPSFNLLGEISLLNSLIQYSNFNMFFLMFLSFFSAVYSLFLYSFSQHGQFSISYSFEMCNVREFMLLIFHWFPLNLIVFLGDSFFCWV